MLFPRPPRDLPVVPTCRSSPKLCLIANHRHIPRHPVPLEGRFAIVTDVGTGCGGRDGGARRATLIGLLPGLRRHGTKTAGKAFAEGVRGRRSRVVLMPRRWHQVGDDALHRADDGGKKARSPGRARYKP